MLGVTIWSIQAVQHPSRFFSIDRMRDFVARARAWRGAAAEARGRYRLWRGTFAEAATPRHSCHRPMPSARRSEHVPTWPLRIARTSRAVRATRVPEGHRGPTRVYLCSTVRWVQIMKPGRLHSVDPGECNRPPDQPARTRGRPQRYTPLRNRECPRVSGGVT